MGDTTAKSRTKSDAETEGDAIAARAIGQDLGRRNRRAGTDVKRADRRGVYRDTFGKRRVVGAGQPVPTGWELIDDAPLEDRAEGLVARGGAEGNAGEATPAGSGGGAKK